MRYIGVFAFVICGVLLFGSPVFASSLFDAAEEDIPVYGDGTHVFTSDSSLPDYAVDDDGNVVSDSLPEPADVSGNDGVAAADAEAVTYAQVASIVEDAVADTYSVNVSLADAYLSSSIVDCFSRVVDGLPVGTHYVAYRINASDSSEGYMFYSDDAKVEGGMIVFPSGGTLVHYYRVSYSSGGYQTYYDYKYDVFNTSEQYSVPYNGGQLLYTDLVDGFPVLSSASDDGFLDRIVIFVVLLCVVLIVFRRK